MEDRDKAWINGTTIKKKKIPCPTMCLYVAPRPAPRIATVLPFVLPLVLHPALPHALQVALPFALCLALHTAFLASPLCTSKIFFSFALLFISAQL
jgi:hypothetical protein